MKARQAVAFGGLAVAVAGLAWLVSAFGTLRTDMDILMPRAAGTEARFAVDQLRGGPASRVIVVGITGAPADILARLSDALSRDLVANQGFTFVANGRARVDRETLDWIRQYRYLLNPPVAASDFTADALGAAFRTVLERLSTSTGLVAEDLLFADPTSRTLAIVRHLAAGRAPATRQGVWFSREENMALLVARTRAAGTEIDGQAAAINRIRDSVRRHAQDVGAEGVEVLVSGAGVFGVTVRDRIKSEMVWLSAAASLFVLLLMIATLRSPVTVAALILTIASAVAGGAAAVQLIFGSIHGITLTFGAMLVGVAIDYPVHVAVHAGREGPAAAARRIWPTLRLSALTTAVAFLPFTLSTFPGLAQLGVISIAGILIAVSISRWVLPSMLGTGARARIPSLLGRIPRRGRPARLVTGAILLLGIGGALYLTIADRPVWEDDLSRLSPLPESQVSLDRRLRSQLSTVNPRYMLLLPADSRQAALGKSEAAARYLTALQEEGRIDGFDAPSRYVPSADAQRARQIVLPPRESLEAAVDRASQGLPFREGAFGTFVDDVARNKRGGVAMPETLSGTDLQAHVDALLFERGGRWWALIMFAGAEPPVDAMRRAGELTRLGGRILDLAAEANKVVRDYRREALLWLLAGAFLSMAILMLGCRGINEGAKVFLPVAVAVASTSILLLVMGVELSLFHLMALIVVGGIGFDYALFLRRSARQEDGDSSLRAVTLCGLTTVGVFSILALSTLPILAGIGLTTAIGAAFALLVSYLVAGMRWHRSEKT